jgi:hypothetical protein
MKKGFWPLLYGKLMFQLETLIRIAHVHTEPKLEFGIGKFISREIR